MTGLATFFDQVALSWRHLILNKRHDDDRLRLAKTINPVYLIYLFFVGSLTIEEGNERSQEGGLLTVALLFEEDDELVCARLFLVVFQQSSF